MITDVHAHRYPGQYLELRGRPGGSGRQDLGAARLVPGVPLAGRSGLVRDCLAVESLDFLT